MSDRLDQLRGLLEEPLLVTNPNSVFYLTGFKSSNAALLVDTDRVQLFTDFRYASAARGVEKVEFVETKRDVLGDLASRLKGRIGFESAYVTYAGYEKLRSDGLELVARPGLVEPFVGRTERDVAWTMTQLFHDEGAHDLSFELIVASGPNSAKPHARAGDREIGRSETVVIDAGCVVDGYASDYTRTFATGTLPDDLREAYSVVVEAQQAALDGIHAGQTGRDADALARSVVEGSRFSGLFGHGLGHGLGIEVHEAPRLSAESTDTLETGNVATVEPGIYVADRGGIRIEDNVVVTDGGIENLTHLRKDLIDVG
ncbi:MAG: aminopeptidase P family protein [Acidobacteria bacterium]|nr:aminopeptidase P family protein [Acidobacteriota bacterium]